MGNTISPAACSLCKQSMATTNQGYTKSSKCLQCSISQTKASSTETYRTFESSIIDATALNTSRAANTPARDRREIIAIAQGSVEEYRRRRRQAIEKLWRDFRTTWDGAVKDKDKEHMKVELEKDRDGLVTGVLITWFDAKEKKTSSEMVLYPTD